MGGRLRFTEDEFGFSHKFIFPSGTDLSWATTIQMLIKDGSTTKLDTTANFVVAPNNTITWTPGNILNFSGQKLNGIFLFTDGGTRQEEVSFDVEAIPSNV